ncbi:MAG: YqeG family HAD IIIA-type phosphatase [Eubacterium sp.]|nr:YqeG family HAD IIIA-type phosphatase [Eubacterium sp.]
MKFTNLFPGEYELSTYDIPYESLYREGFRGIIYDIDNTLVAHGAPADERAKKHFKYLYELGFKCCLLSNNDEPRVKSFADDVGALYIYKAGKPKRRGYEKAVDLLGVKKESTIFIGDQIFTDIWGANRAGIRNIMVRRLYPKEEIQIIFKRIPEFFVLFFYRLYKKNKR